MCSFGVLEGKNTYSGRGVPQIFAPFRGSPLHLLSYNTHGGDIQHSTRTTGFLNVHQKNLYSKIDNLTVRTEVMFHVNERNKKANNP